jgi:hypothetical protein
MKKRLVYILALFLSLWSCRKENQVETQAMALDSIREAKEATYTEFNQEQVTLSEFAKSDSAYFMLLDFQVEANESFKDTDKPLPIASNLDEPKIK